MVPKVWEFRGEVTIEKMPERMGTSGSYEIYRNSPETTQPQDLRTDLYIPLEAL
jgi:effector-binding domain-containing protein